MYVRTMILWFAVLLFLGAGNAALAKGDSILVIDSRLLLAAHPLMKQFDMNTRRFRDTFSDPTLVRQHGREGLEREIERAQKELKRLQSEFKTSTRGKTGKALQELEAAFLPRQKQQEAYINRLAFQRSSIIDIPGYQAFSLPMMILPEVIRLAEDIRLTLVEVKARHQADIVLDVAALLPAQRLPVDLDLLSRPVLPMFIAGNSHSGDTSGGSKTTPTSAKQGNPGKPAHSGADLPPNHPDLKTWTANAYAYWANHEELLNPVVSESQDCRLEAVEILETILKNRKDQ
jgi:hypothetical protein